ncbi:MAG: hypothetical protein U0271_42460 [Polyangiaceae bacterium]
MSSFVLDLLEGEHPAEVALAHTGGALSLAVELGHPVLSVAVVGRSGAPTLVLGATQHAGRVLDLEACARSKTSVLRRTTTGTAVALDGGLVVALAVPEIDALFDDATPKNAVNRYVRPLLHGLRACKIPAMYLGREWIAADRRPIGVLGLEGSLDSALVLELFITASGSLAVPRELATPLERGLDRYRGKAPLSLDEALRGAPAASLVEPFVEGVARAVSMEPATHEASSAQVVFIEEVTRTTSPIDDGAKFLAPIEVPIGYLDVARTSLGVWVGGDALTTTSALGFSSELALETTTPLEGCLWSDLRRARELAAQFS